MSIFVKQDETRSRLQQEIAAELQEKARKRAEQADLPDGVEDSRYIEGTKRTTSLAWIWGIVAIVLIAVIIFLMIKK